VDISVPLETQLDVSVPLEEQMDVSPHNATYHYCCTKKKIFRSRHLCVCVCECEFFCLFKLFLFFIHKYLCLYILGHICNVRNY